MSKKKPEHYVNNKELLEALIVYRKKVENEFFKRNSRIPTREDRSKNWEGKPSIPNYLGDCFLKIATHLSYKPNFVNYMFREDMISDGVENCLHRSTIIPTIEYGPIEIEKLVGKEVTIRCKDGKWRKAQAKSYGVQMLYEYGIASFNVPIENVFQKVIATENHRWFVTSRRNNQKITIGDQAITDLKIGDCLQNAPIENNYDRNAILHGLLYPGQRSFVYETLSLYIEKSFAMKNLPFNTYPEYIAGFIHGWWLADGNKMNSNNELQITTKNHSAAEWLVSHAAYAGYHVVGYDRNDSYLNVITLAKPEEYEPKVRYIKEYGEDEVFCLEEKETNSFVVGNGLLTGNCIQYIHNFDPDKSKNPFAYFTQIIHYAFLRRIQKEKKQLEVKTKLIERSGYDEVMMIDESLLSGNSSEYNSIKDAIQYRNNNR